MTAFPRLCLVLFCLFSMAAPAVAAEGPATVPDRVLGNASAPVTVEEFVSLTCPHCADFTATILPELEKRYVDTGKVKFILRDFPLDGMGLKAAALARCMPEDEFYPFVTVLFKNQQSWALATDADRKLVQYATLGGLPADKAKACLEDAKMQEAVAAERTSATEKYGVSSTPTFVVNGGTDKIEGAKPLVEFSAILDKQLAALKTDKK